MNVVLIVRDLVAAGCLVVIGSNSDMMYIFRWLFLVLFVFSGVILIPVGC